MRHRRNKVRPAKVRYADGFRRFLDSFVGPYNRVGGFRPDVIVTEVNRENAHKAIWCENIVSDITNMLIDPIQIPASSLKVGTLIHVEATGTLT